MASAYAVPMRVSSLSVPVIVAASATPPATTMVTITRLDISPVLRIYSPPSSQGGREKVRPSYPCCSSASLRPEEATVLTKMAQAGGFVGPAAALVSPVATLVRLARALHERTS